ncbi:MAG: hypothetical protein ACFFBK_15190 [Promethearchaeota archaeon]
MINLILLIGSILLIFWGFAHLIPTKSVVKDFGEITQDNKYIITMEWMIEGLSLIFIGVLVLFVTFFGDPAESASKLVYWLSTVMLFSFAFLSLMTCFKVNFIPFKLCPFILIYREF